VKRNTYSLLNNFMNLLPPYGKSLSRRGKLAKKVLKKCGENLKISANVNIYNPENVICGDHVYIGYGSYIGGGQVQLDNQVMIGPYCSIVAGNHTLKDESYRFGPYDFGSIHIGEGTWLGSHCVITNNVTIGKCCLIAAGAIVTRNLPDYSVAAGVPAKVIKTINSTDSEEGDIQ